MRSQPGPRSPSLPRSSMSYLLAVECLTHAQMLGIAAVAAFIYFI